MSERIIDHISLNVADFSAMIAFYEKALAPLGVKGADAVRQGGDWQFRDGRVRPGETVSVDRRCRQDRTARASRAKGGQRRRGRCLLPGGDRRRRAGQWRAGPASALPSRLLRRLRDRSRGPQSRSRLPSRGVNDRRATLTRAAANAARCAMLLAANPSIRISAIAACARRRLAAFSRRSVRRSVTSTGRAGADAFRQLQHRRARLLRGLRHAAHLSLSRERAIESAIGSLDDPAAVRAGHPGNMARKAALRWFDDLAALPDTRTERRPARGRCKPASSRTQHPDHDTAEWPPQDGEGAT